MPLLKHLSHSFHFSVFKYFFYIWFEIYHCSWWDKASFLTSVAENFSSSMMPVLLSEINSIIYISLMMTALKHWFKISKCNSVSYDFIFCLMYSFTVCSILNRLNESTLREVISFQISSLRNLNLIQTLLMLNFTDLTVEIIESIKISYGF